ncbi:MAG: glycosyltransferase [Woeseiaceae bacterium]
MTDSVKGATMVYFGPEPWHGLWRNRHQLMSRFAKHNDVWYVEPPTLLRELLRGKSFRTRLFTRDASGVTIFHSPWWLLIIGREPFKRINIRLFIFVLSLVAGLRKRRPIAWFSKPDMIDFLHALPARLSIYHVVDEYSGYGNPSEVQRRKIEAREITMLRAADLAIVVTPTLLAKKSPFSAHAHLVPNAVDFAAYANCSKDVPEDMQQIRSPIIGYTGLISARLNLDLLREAATARNDWNFVFVGIVNEDGSHDEFQALRALRNVYFLGRKSVANTPRYVCQFDVCMIPYTINLRAENASPLKLYEYAAASKPVVATDFSAARDFEGNISIVDNAASFIAACETCLDTASMAAGIAANRRYAENNTWDHRVRQVSEIIRSYECL